MNIPQSEIQKLPPIVRKFFWQWDSFLLQRVKFNRPESEVHAFGHCERVLLFALLIGEKIFGADENALEILAQAAVFHDSRRQDDYLDIGHGARAAVYYEDFCKKNPDVTYHPEVVYLMRYHDLDDKHGFEAIREKFGEDFWRVIVLYKIFKDADALDRWRLGGNGLDTQFLRTSFAKEMTDYSRRIVQATIPAQALKQTEEEVERVIRQQIKNKEGNRMLLIIDPQIDFVTGSLPVPGAVQAMDSLSEYIGHTGSDYSHIIVTADRHPMRHRSFKSEGGEWPVHCVEDSVGAALWPPIMERLLDIPDKVTILHKGENAAIEEYSILKNKEAREQIYAIINDKTIGKIDICGLAGDVCVADTIRDWITFSEKTDLRVLQQFSPSIDGGKTLDSLISKYRLIGKS